MNFYKRWLGDYQRKTSGLSPLEHGVYNLLLDAHYATENPLPTDDGELRRIVGAFSDDEHAALRKVLTRFWSETPGGWTNKRAQEEMENFRDKSGKATAAANKRWEEERKAKRMRTHNERISERNASQSQNTEPEPKPEQRSKSKTEVKGLVARRVAPRPANPANGMIDFDRFKAAYPKRHGSQPWSRAMKAATARIREGATFDAMVDGALRYAAHIDAKGDTGSEFVMQAVTFLGPDRHFLEPWSAPPPQPPGNENPIDQMKRLEAEGKI